MTSSSFLFLFLFSSKRSKDATRTDYQALGPLVLGVFTRTLDPGINTPIPPGLFIQTICSVNPIETLIPSHLSLQTPTTTEALNPL
ncbi:hypothetical protein L6452_00912 [Arctium lappa]|uniref:Uncharacterized protein n=1 Tax=Arctium lappa TaxID=4217 RepID=A0ACB9FET1_ARCLA|nr:hypothetical protein L6452_00912 [Arctium lappa]